MEARRKNLKQTIMAYKMKGAPMYDTSSKHGTNANYKKSGPPNLLGKIFDPLNLKDKLMGGNKSNCPPQQQQQVIGGPKPVEPVTPNAVSNATTTNAPGMTENVDPAAQSAAGGATMKKGLKNGAPMKTDPRKTPEYKRALQSERDLYAADNRKKNKGTIKGKMIETIERGVDKVKRKFGASDPTPKGMATPKRVAPHEIKHGGMKKARLGGLRATKPTTETRSMTKKEKLKAMATGGVKAMVSGGAGKAVGKMTRRLTSNLHKKK